MTPVKIGFVLLSNSRNPIPSTRISVLNILPFLRAANFDPHIVFEPQQDTETPDVSHLLPRLINEGFDIVFFQKVHGPSVENLAYQLSSKGVKTVYGVCDLVKIAMTSATDATVTVTEYLKSLYPPSLQSKVHVAHDGIERPEIHKAEWAGHYGSRTKPLNAVLVTSQSLDQLPVINKPPPWLKVTIVGRYPATGQTLQRLTEARWKLGAQKNFSERLAYLRFLANRRIERVKWEAVGVYEIMRNADIGIIPIDTWNDADDNFPPSWKVKSENRLTMKMAVGLPVIATPIPAYEPVIKQGENGFLARSPQEWFESLDALRDPELRYKIGNRARESVLNRYSIEEQAQRLINVLRSVMLNS